MNLPLRRRADPGRARVVGWILGVVALSLVILTLAVSFILRASVATGIRDGIDQESAEIAQFAAEGVDPETGEPFSDAGRLVDVYMERQAAERGELIVGVIPGRAPIEVRGPLAGGLTDIDPQAWATIVSPDSLGTLTSNSAGVLSWRTSAIVSGDDTATITVVGFHSEREAEILQQVGLFSLMGLGVLAVSGGVAWWVAGRITQPVVQFEHVVGALGAHGQAVRVPEHGTDEYRRIARAANQLGLRAEAVVDESRRFVDDAAYALRTPLAVLRGGLAEPEAVREVERLERAVGHLVLLSRAEREAWVLPEDGVDMQAYLENAVARWDRAVLGHARGEVPVEVRVAPALVGRLDRPRLARAIDELLRNAVDASSRPGTVELSAHGVQDVGGRSALVIDVADRGRGVPESDLGTVKQRFARASNDEEALGMGLGLALADQIVQRHGGTLALLPRADGGTVARIVLPRGDQPASGG